MKQKDLGKYFSFRFKYVNEVTTYSGYLLDFSEDWVLLKYNPQDYEIDGYIILRNRDITHYKRDSNDRFREKVLNLKGYKPEPNALIPITDIKTILNYLTGKYGAFQFDMRSNTRCWLGKVKTLEAQTLYLYDLTPKGKWNHRGPTFSLGNIRTIQFNTDYINSLLLVARTTKG